jgi:transcriptional regulator with GAF, ATPase, and Fis domain
VLALSNEPQQLVEMVLDRLLHLFGVDYSWVQLVGSEDRKLRLVASRCSTPEILRVAALADSQRVLGERVLVGLKVVVPDLSRDGRDGLSSFGRAGLRSLVAVPIRTYHTQGVIGVASRTKKYLDDEIAELLMTVAGLVGATLNIAELGRIAMNREKQRAADKMSNGEPDTAGNDSQSVLVTRSELLLPEQSASSESNPDVGRQKSGSTEDDAVGGSIFVDHSRSMLAFRRAHDNE